MRAKLLSSLSVSLFVRGVATSLKFSITFTERTFQTLGFLCFAAAPSHPAVMPVMIRCNVVNACSSKFRDEAAERESREVSSLSLV